jgi:TolB protein
MRLNARKLFLTGVSTAIMLMVAIGLLLPARPDRFLPAHANQAEPGNPSLPPGTDLSSPAVNASAFKGQGRLAVVGQDLISVLDGQTGRASIFFNMDRSTNPAWSYDGKWFACRCESDPDSAPDTLWLVSMAGAEPHQFEIPKPEDSGFSWSPTDDVLAVGGRNGIWLLPAEGKPYQL